MPTWMRNRWRLDRYLKKDRGPDSPLAKWKELLPKSGGAVEPPVEVQKLAETFSGTSDQEPLRAHQQIRNLDQQKELFGEQGVFPLIEAMLVEGAGGEWKAEHAKLKALAQAAQDRTPPAPPICQAVKEEPTDRIKDLKVYLRGNPAKQGELAPRRFLRILAGDDVPSFKQGSGRLELAEAIASAVKSTYGESWSTASGNNTSAAGSCEPRRTSANWARRPPILNCSTTSPTSL